MPEIKRIANPPEPPADKQAELWCIIVKDDEGKIIDIQGNPRRYQVGQKPDWVYTKRDMSYYRQPTDVHIDENGDDGSDGQPSDSSDSDYYDSEGDYDNSDSDESDSDSNKDDSNKDDSDKYDSDNHDSDKYDSDNHNSDKDDSNKDDSDKDAFLFRNEMCNLIRQVKRYAYPLTKMKEADPTKTVVEGHLAMKQLNNLLHRNETKWMEKYDQLVEYKQEHGSELFCCCDSTSYPHIEIKYTPHSYSCLVDCNVPKRYTDNPELWSWVSNQRNAQHRRKISESRYYLLNAIDFVWKLGRGCRVENQWVKTYNQLVEYQEEHGSKLLLILFL